MKKILLTFVLLISVMAGVFAQAPQKFSYQAVVRDVGNNLVTSHAVGVRISILQGGVTGNAVYMESQTITTNANGLMTVVIGNGTTLYGDMASIDWAGGPYFLKTETDPNGGTNYTIEGTQQLLSVPYALYAESSANGFSGNYNDLTNQPTIPAVPTNVSDFANDASYVNNADCNNVSFCDLLNMLTALQNTVDSLAAVVAGNNPDPCAPTSSTHNIEITTDELPYAFGDTTFLAGTETGTYVLVRTNAAGCDSTITINLTVNEPAEDFICGTSTITDADNNAYNTVRIGTQCWMKENLRTTKKPDGTTISSGIWAPGSNSVTTYGRLYSWSTVMNEAPSSNATPSNVQGICPNGWHVPSDAEWTQLTDYVSSQSSYCCSGNTSNIAKALASTTGWNSYTGNDSGKACYPGYNSSGNNATGFSALPAGYYLGSYYDFGLDAYFWSATEYSSTRAYSRELGFDYTYVDRTYGNKSNGFSVRCVRDIAEPCAPTSSTHNIEITTAELPYEFGDTTFLAGTETGTYVLVRTNAGGCDSTITINLTVNEPAEDFICGTSTITDADNNTYNTVRIGTQCWMKENLRTTKKPDGTTISSGIWAPGSNSVTTYGRLYSWTTVMNGASSSNSNPSGVQGICPDGWHVPSDAEWIQMEKTVGISQSDANNTGYRGNIAAKLCGNTGWSSSITANAAGNLSAPDRNSTGFSALPAGYYNSSYINFGLDADFWSATEGSSDLAYYRRLNYNFAGVARYNLTKSYGYSVRCVRDIAEEATDPCAPTSSTHDIEITTDELPYAFGDTTFLAGTATGTYTLHRTNAGGCDSTITVNLTISAPAFTCGTSTISDVDGNTYNTVQIGTQCWMKENLKTTKYADDTPIENGSAPSYNVAYWYYPNNWEANKATYGLLYNWKATMRDAASTTANPSNVQGICPDGWHVPSDNEWKQMEMAVGMSQSDANLLAQYRGNIAAKLCGNTGWNSSANANAAGNLNAPDRNSTGFSALPAGYYASYFIFGSYANFWSATEDNSDYAYCRDLYYGNAGVYRVNSNKSCGYSVRCVRD